MECSAAVISQDLYLYVLSVWVDKCKKWRSVPYLRCELLGCTGSCKSCTRYNNCCNEGNCNAICNAPEKEYLQSILKFLLIILASGLEFSSQKEKSKNSGKQKELDSEKKQVDDFLDELKKTDNTMCCHCSKLPRMLFFENDIPYFELLRELSFEVYEENFCQHSSLIQSYSQEKESIIYLVEYLWTAFFIGKDSECLRGCLSSALDKMKTGDEKEKMLFINALMGNPDKNYGDSGCEAYKKLYDLTRSIFVFNPELAQKKSQQVRNSLDTYLEYYRLQKDILTMLQQDTHDSLQNQIDFSL